MLYSCTHMATVGVKGLTTATSHVTVHFTAPHNTNHARRMSRPYNAMAMSCTMQQTD